MRNEREVVVPSVDLVEKISKASKEAVVLEMPVFKLKLEALEPIRVSVERGMARISNLLVANIVKEVTARSEEN